LYIFLAVILFLFILLLSPIRIGFSYHDGNTTLTVRYLLIKIDILKWAGKRKKKQETKDKVQPKPKEPEEAEPQTKIKDILKHFEKIFSYVKREFSIFRRCVVFNRLHFRVSFSTGDAAKTAISYGVICTLVYNFFSYFNYNFKIKDQNITVVPYYTDPCFQTDCRCDISVRLLWVVGMGLLLAWAAVDILSKIKGKHKKIKVGEQI
jgi:hypothetical protein